MPNSLGSTACGAARENRWHFCQPYLESGAAGGATVSLDSGQHGSPGHVGYLR